MAIVKNKLRHKWTQVPNAIVLDTSLKAPAFRLYVYIRSKPDGWEVWNKDICKKLGIKDPKTIASYWKQLIKAGWITRIPSRNDKGELGTGYDYEIHDEPNHQKTPNGEKPQSGKNPHHSNTNSNNKTKKKKKKGKGKGLSPKAQSSKTTVSDVLKKLENTEVHDHDFYLNLFRYKKFKKDLYILFAKFAKLHNPSMGMISLSHVDKSKLGMIMDSIGTKNYKTVVPEILRDWEVFTKHCEIAHGAFKCPKYPTIPFLLQHRVGINTFASDVLNKSKAKVGKKVPKNEDDMPDHMKNWDSK